MIGFIKKLFGSKPANTTEVVVDTRVEAANLAPYKVEAVSEKAVEAVIKSIEPPKKPAPKKTSAPKTAKPKAPRKPKAKPAV